MVVIIAIVVIALILWRNADFIAWKIKHIKKVPEVAKEKTAAEVAGEKFEDEVAEAFKPLGGELCRNIITLKCNNRGSKEIDLVAVTTKGVFVAEIKNYKGHISQDPNKGKGYWLASYGGNSFPLAPLKQVKDAVYELKYRMPTTSFSKMVIFSDEATIENSIKEGSVYSLSEVKRFIAHLKGEPDVLSNEEVSKIAQKVREMNTISRERHLAYVRGCVF